MKQLGDLILPDSLQWVDRYAFSPVTQTVVQTLSGTPVVFGRTRVMGPPITLVADKEETWLNTATVDALLVMARQSGLTFTLVWEDLTHTVWFRHHDPPALTLQPIWPQQPYFIGTIKLMAC